MVRTRGAGACYVVSFRCRAEIDDNLRGQFLFLTLELASSEHGEVRRVVPVSVDRRLLVERRLDCLHGNGDVR